MKATDRKQYVLFFIFLKLILRSKSHFKNIYMYKKSAIIIDYYLYLRRGKCLFICFE